MTDSNPNTPIKISSNNSTSVDNNLVKTATPQYVLLNEESTPVELMTKLIFEDIGSQEILNISRNDTVFGSNLIYEPIGNSNQIYQKYNSYNLSPVDQTSLQYFKNFPILFESKIPNVASGPNNSNIYIDEITGNIVIELINMEKDEQVEVEILLNGNTYYDTI